MKTIASLSDSSLVQVACPPVVDERQLMDELHAAKMELDMATQQFDFVIEPLLVDHIIFRIGAAEKRVNYLLQTARKMNIVSPWERWDRDRRG